MTIIDTLPVELPDVDIDAIVTTPNGIQIEAHSRKNKATCPACQQPSTRIHSHYTRQPQDLTCLGQSVWLKLTVTRFRCLNPNCSRQTFVERLPNLVPFYARCTHRLITVMRTIVFEVGAETGARLLAVMGIPTSGDTLLRVLRRTPVPQAPEPRVLGIDDWAFKKGLRYGTILVDLERRRPIDLLPDRQVETVKHWLAQHPSIEIITRDRSQEYAQAITASAPQAIQVADRWHLLKNAADALQKALDKYAKHLREWGTDCQLTRAIQATVEHLPVTAQHERYITRHQRFQQVHDLYSRGWSKKTIARQLGICPRTVSRDLAKDNLHPHRRYRASKLDAYKAYLLQRWNEGCHNARRLTEEIRTQGYGGGKTIVRDFTAQLRHAQADVRPSVSRLLPTSITFRPLTPRQAAFLLLRPADEHEDIQARFLLQLYEHLPELHAVAEPFQQFAAMVREKRGDAFDAWLQAASQSTCRALKQFALGLQRDVEAVRAALSLDWSNGQCEGQINRLKFIKRQMYGRAKFDLLRLRILHSPSWHEICG